MRDNLKKQLVGYIDLVFLSNKLYRVTHRNGTGRLCHPPHPGAIRRSARQNVKCRRHGNDSECLNTTPQRTDSVTSLAITYRAVCPGTLVSEVTAPDDTQHTFTTVNSPRFHMHIRSSAPERI